VTADIVVVCSTYQRPERLAQLVAALEAQDLDRDRFEVNIVDNGSHDQTGTVLAALAERSPLRIHARAIDVNHGPAAARNLGWRSSDAPFVAFTDDDCLPQPGWLRAGLAALSSDPAVGVVQGRVEPGDGPIGDWTLQRIVRGPTPFFEGCNIFYRRDALEATGGFDEGIGWYGEDTTLGWSVIDAGWRRDYADKAVVIHPLEERPLRWHMQSAYLEGNLVGIAHRFPAFANDAFHRPWAFHPHDGRAVLALVGVVAAVRHPWTLALAYPWYRMRRAAPGHHRALALIAERAVVDAASVLGLLRASVRERHLVI
jgi:GT2 family glycosyltransferase